MAVTKVIEARTRDQVEYSGESQEQCQGKVQEAVLHRAKATIKDSKTLTWECLREGALAEDIRRNRKQRTGVAAGEEAGEEAGVVRHLEKVSRMSIRFCMAIIGLRSLKGSVFQREEEANSIKERGGFMKERPHNCSRLTSSTVIRRDTAPVTTL